MSRSDYNLDMENKNPLYVSNMKNESIILKFGDGTKLIYDINKDLGLEIHLPYISGNLNYRIQKSNKTSNLYQTSITFLNNALINIKFYY